MNNMQALIDAMGAASRQTRSGYHVTLGQLIAILEPYNPEWPVITTEGSAPGKALSYRGYYSDLAFEPAGEECTCGKLLLEAKNALGATFEGYKGGEFSMAEDTPLWIANYGCTGLAVVDTRDNGSALVLVTKNVRD